MEDHGDDDTGIMAVIDGKDNYIFFVQSIEKKIRDRWDRLIIHFFVQSIEKKLYINFSSNLKLFHTQQTQPCNFFHMVGVN